MTSPDTSCTAYDYYDRDDNRISQVNSTRTGRILLRWPIVQVNTAIT